MLVDIFDFGDGLGNTGECDSHVGEGQWGILVDEIMLLADYICYLYNILFGPSVWWFVM